jgi:fatty acid synthase
VCACCAAPQTHGYGSRVQFRLACTKIPKDVLLLEIGPHALMRSPLRQNRCPRALGLQIKHQIWRH